jgi:hypothetical protein
MKGANKYALLFSTGQYGKLYITSGDHARGLTFRIQVLPEGEKAIPNGSGNTCINTSAVTVYGMISGQRGWTEVYGWKHKGKWVDDFEKLYQDAKLKKESNIATASKEKAKRENNKLVVESELLSNY